jgi:CRISPR-associated endonuclease Cas1
MGGSVSDRLISAGDDIAWAERCEYWADEPTEPKRRGRRPRHVNRPLVLTGHGMRLNVHQGTLLIKGGFTHYPQQQDEYRFFPGDRELPSRIIVVDGTGSITFDVLSWLSEQNVPLIRIDWQGNVTTVISNGYGPDPKCVRAQLAAQTKERAMKIAISLVCAKLRNSIETLKILPKSEKQVRAIANQKHEIQVLENNPPKIINGLLGIEGRAAFAYFLGWQNVPLHWKGIGRRPIPKNWHEIGPRTSANGNFGRSRHASHPVNAILNYAYAILESHVRTEITTLGYDPTIGYLHMHQKDRAALVFDLMEPLRPVVDRAIVEFIQSKVFQPTDFTIRNDGVCRLNPEMARHVASLISGTLNPATSFPLVLGK